MGKSSSLCVKVFFPRFVRVGIKFVNIIQIARMNHEKAALGCFTFSRRASLSLSLCVSLQPLGND